MKRNTRSSRLALMAVSMLAFLFASGALAAPAPPLSRHVAINGPVELTLTVTPSVARPRDTVTLQIGLVNRQAQATAPEILVLLPAGLSPRGGRLPAGTTFNFQENSLSWMPVLAADGGTASFQLEFVASVADLQQPAHSVEARLRYGGQEQIASVELWVGLPPAVSVGASPALVSVGEPVQLTALTTGPGPFVQMWDLGDGRELGATDPQVVYSSPGTYQVTASVSNPLALASGSVTVTVVAKPLAAFSVDDPLPVVSQTVQFASHSGGQQPLQYRWDFGDGATSGEASPSHRYSEPGTYTVQLVVTSEHGMDEANQTITVGAAPVVDFVLNDSAATGQPFYGQAYSDNSTTLLQWDMGDGRRYEGAIVEHVYYTAGDFLVTLRGENEFGTTEVSHWVHVEAGAFFSLMPLVVGQPTASSPPLQLDLSAAAPAGEMPIELAPAPVLDVGQPASQPELAAPLPGTAEPVAVPSRPAPVGSGAAAEPPAIVATPITAQPVIAEPQPPLAPGASQAEQLLWYINEARRLHGLAPLVYSYELSIAAQLHTEDMVGNPEIMHDGSDGSLPPERQRRYGYQGIYGGEAVAWGFDSAAPVVEFWVNSPPHRILILNPNAREVGVGYYADGRAPNIWYWTAEFGILLDPATTSP
jgi:uncharacterized protein YkwD/PKD repeat protein